MSAANLVRAVLSRVLPSRRMRSDWDARARADAHHYIDCGHSDSDASFWASGIADLEALILQDVALAPQARALEIGCGVGRLLRPLSQRVERAIGVDISPEMIARAREALASCPNVTLAVTRGDLAFVADASLDFVTSFIVFQHVPSRSAVSLYASEAARVLKGGGVFRFQVDGRRRTRWLGSNTWTGVSFEADDLSRRLGSMGFDVVDRWGEGTHYLWITARRIANSGRPGTEAVSVRRREWNTAAVERLAQDVGAHGPEAAADVIAGRLSLRALARGFVRSRRRSETPAFVRAAYDVLLGRPADREGLAFYGAEIGRGRPRTYVVDCLLASPEARDRFRRVVR